MAIRKKIDNLKDVERSARDVLDTSNRSGLFMEIKTLINDFLEAIDYNQE